MAWLNPENEEYLSRPRSIPLALDLTATARNRRCLTYPERRPTDLERRARHVNERPLATSARAFKSSSSIVRSSSKGHKLGQVCAEASLITQIESTVGQCVASTTAPSILRLSCF